MQNEFQSYLSFKKDKEEKESLLTKSAMTSIQKSPIREPKHLYDSEYKVPMLNERVL